ncbi:RTX toxin [Labilithrix luteola]|uniref:RTX toxin n=1 Tax=Labilithrix luteola TaxID=1391654 RepID=A0A0K1QGM6_9BACT|nr:delta-60 repeat domain-containing protein [Labilithrix luteola]AKV04802.1 RTX toxin [Labilithrix luteola]
MPFIARRPKTSTVSPVFSRTLTVRSPVIALLCTTIAGCSAILGFDKDVSSVDDDAPNVSGGDGGTSPGVRDGASNDDVDVKPLDDASAPVPLESYLDETFGEGGRVIVPGVDVSGTGYPVVCRTATTTDHAVWFACSLLSSSGPTRLYRLGPDGKRDTSVTGDVIASTYSWLVAQDVRVVAVGHSQGTNAVFRHLQTGALDTTFGSGGKLTKSMSGGGSVFFGSALRMDGTLWLGGTTTTVGGGHTDGVVTSLNLATGTLGSELLDTKPLFASAPDSPPSFSATAIATIDANTVELVGNYVTTTANQLTFGFVRFKSNALDSTFGTGGLVTRVHADNVRSSMTSLLGGKALFGSYQLASNAGTLSRFTLDGAPDTTFAGTGTLALGIPTNAPAGVTALQVFGVAEGPNATFYVGGAAWLGVQRRRGFIARFNDDGSPDTTFGDGGYVFPKVRANPTFEEVRTLARQDDGSVVVVGQSVSLTNETDVFAVRLKP